MKDEQPLFHASKRAAEIIQKSIQAGYKLGFNTKDINDSLHNDIFAEIINAEFYSLVKAAKDFNQASLNLVNSVEPDWHKWHKSRHEFAEVLSLIIEKL